VTGVAEDDGAGTLDAAGGSTIKSSGAGELTAVGGGLVSAGAGTGREVVTTGGAAATTPGCSFGRNRTLGAAESSVGDVSAEPGSPFAGKTEEAKSTPAPPPDVPVGALVPEPSVACRRGFKRRVADDALGS